MVLGLGILGTDRPCSEEEGVMAEACGATRLGEGGLCRRGLGTLKSVAPDSFIPLRFPGVRHGTRLPCAQICCFYLVWCRWLQWGLVRGADSVLTS